MKQVFRAHRLCEQDGPLSPYIESYDAEMRCEGYAQQTREVQTRLVADFGCWLAKRGIQAQNITAELFRPYPPLELRRGPAEERALIGLRADPRWPCRLVRENPQARVVCECIARRQ